MKPCLIIGIGNLLRTDDGVGVHAVNLLNDSGDLPDWAEAVDAGACGLDLQALIKGREKVITIDALETDLRPGSVFRFAASHLTPEPGVKLTLHESGVCDALAALAALGERPDVEIIGVVAKDVESAGMDLTEEVQAALPKACETVLDSMRQYRPYSSVHSTVTAEQEARK
jgi:hydrogenase maturation protease